MSSVYSFERFPVRSRTLENFTAPDPWHGGRPAQWTLEVFLMVHPMMEEAYKSGKRPVPQMGEGARLGRAEVLGVRNGAEGRLRPVPLVLTALWQEAKLKTADLPRVMAAVERGLRPRDYFFLLAPFLKWFGRALLVMAALILVGVLVSRFWFFLWFVAFEGGIGALWLFSLRQWERQAVTTREAALKLI